MNSFFGLFSFTSIEHIDGCIVYENVVIVKDFTLSECGDAACLCGFLFEQGEKFRLAIFNLNTQMITFNRDGGSGFRFAKGMVGCIPVRQEQLARIIPNKRHHS